MELVTENAPSHTNHGVKSNLSYRCNICLEKFAEIQSLDTHMLLHDLQKPYRCNYCACSYGNIKSLQVHVATHNVDMPYACERCDDIFCVLGELQSHVETNCQQKHDKQRENEANNKSSHPGLRTRPNSMDKRVSYCDDEDDFVDDYLDNDFINETMVTVPQNRNSLLATKKTMLKKDMVKSPNVLHTTNKVLTAGDETNLTGYVSLSNLSVSMASNKSLIRKPVSDIVNESPGIDIQDRQRPVVLSNNHRLFSAYIPLMDVGKLEQIAKQKNNKLKNVSKNLQALKSLKKAKLSGVRKRAPRMTVSNTAWSICTYCCEVHRNIRRHHNKHGRSLLEHCGFCHLKLSNRYSVLRHCRLTHIKQNCLHCKFCDTFIGSEQQYLRHYLERHADTQISNVQDAISVEPLERHADTQISNVQDTISVEPLERHANTQISNVQDAISVEPPIEKLQIKLENADEAIVGGVCVKCCEFHINLTDHRCKHLKDHRMCGFCYLVLETDLSLTEHYISEHQNKEEFACMICGLFLGSENTYKKHFVEVHSNNSNPRSNMNLTAASKTSDIIAVSNSNYINVCSVANSNDMNMTAVANRNNMNMTAVANRNDINMTAVANSNDLNITNRKVSCMSDEASSVEHTMFNENDTIFPYEDDLNNGADDLEFSESDEDEWYRNDVKHETENGDKKVTKLSICSFCCEVHSNLKRHQFTHSPEILKTCGFCSMKLATKNSVIRHCKLMHKRKKLLQCNLCVNTFPGSETNYIKHVLEFHPSKSTKGVNKDLVEFGSDAEESQYETSSDSSSDVSEDFPSLLDISNTKLYVCEFCCQVTSDLKSHQRDHSNLDLKKCGFCCVVLSSKGSISRHFHQVHRKRKEVDCKLCHQMIGSEKRYIRHYLTMHASHSAKNETKLSVVESPEYQTLQDGNICLVCCEVVQVKMAYHEYAHHEDSVNTCGFCNTVLATKCSLKRHYNRVHRSKGEFMCKFCKKYVGSERNYKKHFLQVHSDKTNVDKSNNWQKPTADAGNTQKPVSAGCTELVTNNETDISPKDKSDTTVMSSLASNDRSEAVMMSSMTTNEVSEAVMMSSMTTNEVSETAVMPSLTTKDKSEGSEKEMSSLVTESTPLSPFSGNNGGLASDTVSKRKLKHMSICEFCCEVHSKIKRHRFCHAQSTLTRCGFCGLKLATKNSVIRHYQKVHLEKHCLFCLICNQMIGMEDDYKIHYLKFHADKTFPDINYQEPHNEIHFDNAEILTSNISSNSTFTTKMDADNNDSRVLIDQISKLPDISDNHDPTSSDLMRMPISDDSDCSMPEMSSSDDDEDEPGDSHLSIAADGSKSSSNFPKTELLEAPPITSTMDEKTSETSIKKINDKMKICRHCCEVCHNLKGHRYQHTQSDLYYCGFCGKTFNSRESSSKHYRVSHKHCNNLVCRFCSNFIGSESEYVEHIVTKHEDKGPTKASEPYAEYVLQQQKERRTRFSVCEYCCEVHKNIRKHYKSHPPAMFGKCGFCGEVVNVKTSAKEHYQQAHRDAKNINCKVCKVTFNSETAYKSHYRSRHSCGFNGQAEQEDVILPIRGQYQCTVCDKAFTRERVFRRHRLSHLEKHITCEICKEVFYGDRMLKIHKKLNHLTDREVTCQICLKVFTSKPNLKTHEKTVHVEDKTYTCHFCTKNYCSRISLKQHVKKYHDSNAKFRFTCKDCGKGFDYKALFRAHQQIHSGEKPWVCEYCGQGFRTKHIFKTHLNRHTDSRPHKCPYCEKSFRQVTTLKTHQRTHTGVKPYVCHECGKSFGDLSNYHSHRRSNHNNRDSKVQTPNVPSRRTRVRKQSTPISSYVSPYPHIPSVPRTTSRDTSSMTVYDEPTPKQQEDLLNYQDCLNQIFQYNKQEH